MVLIYYYFTYNYIKKTTIVNLIIYSCFFILMYKTLEFGQAINITLFPYFKIYLIKSYFSFNIAFFI